MKRILSVLFAATMIFGMAANASANMGPHDFALMTLNLTQSLETVDSMGVVWDGDWTHDPSLPPAGTTITDIFKIENFAGSTDYGELDTIAVSNFHWMPDWTHEKAWIAIQKGETPLFDDNYGSYMTGVTGVANYHPEGSTPEIKPFGVAGQGLQYGGLQNQAFLGFFEHSGHASINLDDILNTPIEMEIWELSMFATASGFHVEYEKSGFDLRIYNSGGALGNESIDATIMEASAVPIPGAVWLLVSGLLTVMGIRRRKL